MRRVLILILGALLAVTALRGATDGAATARSKPAAATVRFFSLGYLPELARPKGGGAAPEIITLNPFALSSPFVAKGGKVELRLAAPSTDPVLAQWTLVLPLPENARELVAFVDAGGPADPVRVVQLLDVSAESLPADTVRVINLLPVELYAAFGQDLKRMAPKQGLVFSPKLDENRSCALRVACADPRGGSPVHMKQGEFWLAEGRRALALALLSRRSPGVGDDGQLLPPGPPKPEWLVFPL